MKVHELANIFPSMSDEEYKALKTDIKKNGLIEPIWTYEGKIIDGRHRYKACQELGVEPKYRAYDDGSPITFIASLNLFRRHLTTSQRAAIAVDSVLQVLEEEAQKRQGYRSDLDQNFDRGDGGSSKEAADIFNTNRQYILDAKKIKDKAPDLFEEVKTGKRNISSALNEIQKRGDKKIDEEHPMSKEEAHKRISFASLSDAIRNAARGDKDDLDWLSTEYDEENNPEYGGEFFCNALGVNYGLLMDWVESGCESRPVHEMLIEMLSRQFEMSQIDSY